MNNQQQQFAAELSEVLAEIKNMLISKNAAYGDSALNPVRIFSRADPLAQIDVRIDDKLSRIVRGTAAGEDVYLDLTGYLLMRRIAQKRIESRTADANYDPT